LVRVRVEKLSGGIRFHSKYALEISRESRWQSIVKNRAGKKKNPFQRTFLTPKRRGEARYPDVGRSHFTGEVHSGLLIAILRSAGGDF